MITCGILGATPFFLETRFLANAMEMSQGSGYPKWAVVKKDHQNRWCPGHQISTHTHTHIARQSFMDCYWHNGEDGSSCSFDKFEISMRLSVPHIVISSLLFSTQPEYLQTSRCTFQVKFVWKSAMHPASSFSAVPWLLPVPQPLQAF